MNDVELQEYLDLVKTTAAQHGLTMYPGLPYRGQAYRELLYPDELHQFISLAIVARTHFLYLDARTLDIDADIENQPPFRAIGDDGEEESAFAAEVYNRAVERWRDRSGALHTVTVTFVIEGVCHRKRETADWYDGYEQALTEAGETLDRRMSQRQKGRWAQRIQELIADPRFPLARNQRQRIRLAEELNPEMTEPASGLVADAMSEIWLREVSEETGL
jgi:hypothetical protein